MEVINRPKKHNKNFSRKIFEKLAQKPLWLRLTGILVLIVFVLDAIILLVVSLIYQSRVEDEYIGKGIAAARIASSMFTGEMVDHYLETLEKDAAYDRILSRMRIVQKENNIKYIYIVKIVEGGAIFVFDTDEEAPVGLGKFDEWSEEYNVVADALLRGETVEPVKLNVKWGWLLVTYEPIRRADGSVAAYAGVDISMDEIMLEWRSAFISMGLILLSLLVVSVMMFLFAVYKIVISPIDSLVDSISTFMPVFTADSQASPRAWPFTKKAKKSKRGGGKKHQAIFRSGNELTALAHAIAAMKQRITTTMAERMRAEELTRLMLDTMPLCCEIWDKNNNIIDCNEAAVRLFGLAGKHEYIKKHYELSPEFQNDGQRSYDKRLVYVKKAFDDGYVIYDWIHKARDGTFIPTEVILVRVNIREGDAVVGYIRDLRNIRQMENDIKLLKSEANKIYYDGLTGINNRRFFDENMKRVMKSLARSSGLLSFMMIDIDHFKKYNDTYGHIAGDDCLKIIAKVLSKCVTRSDDFAARYGGEEFAVVLPNTSGNGARLLAERLLKSIQECGIPHEQNDAANCVTISIGLTTGRVNYTQSADAFIKRADEMLYKSKQGGRNRYTFEDL